MKYSILIYNTFTVTLYNRVFIYIYTILDILVLL